MLKILKFSIEKVDEDDMIWAERAFMGSQIIFAFVAVFFWRPAFAQVILINDMKLEK